MSSEHIQHFEKLRPKLIAFTLLQVPEREHAEDIVQDTMIAALENMHRFAGKASFETWVFSILKQTHRLHSQSTTRARALCLRCNRYRH